jgi:DNA-binding transcriptional MerR regulator
VSSRTYLSIGDVLTLLREEFPDVTISKIRFLESQGLVNPERSPSGYRKFFEPDVERLRWVLRQQREHFLPLKVIRDRLAAGDLGDIEVEPGAETKAEPARRNGAASHPSHATPDGSVRAEGPAASVGSSAGRSTPPVPASGGQRRGSANAAAGRTEAQMAQADNEAMARILADASRRAALIPENASDRAPLHVVPDAGHSAESESVAARTANARGAASPSVVANESQGEGRASESSPARPVGAKHAAVDSSPTSRPPGTAGERDGGASGASGGSTGGATVGASGTSGSAGAPAAGAGAAGAAAGAGAGARVGAGSRGADHRPKGGAPTTPGAPTRNDADDAGKATGSGSSTGSTGSTGSGRSGGAATGPGKPMLTPDMVTGASLTCDELCSASGLSEAELAGLQSFGLIEPVIVAGIPTFDEDALTVANLAADFRKFGIEPRHLRMYRTGVDREIGLIEQVIIPLLRQRNPESRQRATRAAEELGTLGQTMRATLLRSALRRHVGG